MDGFAQGILDDVKKVTKKWAEQSRREKSWLGEFGQGDRWRFCLTAAGMARAQERR